MNLFKWMRRRAIIIPITCYFSASSHSTMVRLAFLTATLVLLKGTSSVTAAAHPPMQKEPRAAPADGHDLLLDTFATYDAPGAAFPAISHPFLPVYADDHGSDSRKNTVPTNAWHSNLFYSSAENLAPTITDPYILRFLDGYGGNPGLSIHQGADKVRFLGFFCLYLTDGYVMCD